MVDYSILLTINTEKELHDYMDNLDLNLNGMTITKEEYNDAKRWGFCGNELKLYVLKERLKDYIFEKRGIDLWKTL